MSRGRRGLPGIRTALRLALTDAYYHAIRLVPANLAWGLGLVVVLGLGFGGQPVLAVIAAPLLALPLVAVARLAGEIVRDEDVVLSDAWIAVRELAGPALLGGALMTVATVVLTANVRFGLTAGTLPAIATAVLAAWGLVALWLLVLPYWVLLADPARSGRGPAAAAREAVALLFIEPRRLVGLAIVLTVVLVVASVLVAALLAVAVAYAALVTARVVLPAADRSAGVSELVPSAD